MDTTVTPTDARLEQIQAGYELLGLGTPQIRASFQTLDPKPAGVQFNVVISTTSQPFGR